MAAGRLSANSSFVFSMEVPSFPTPVYLSSALKNFMSVEVRGCARL